MRLQDLNWMDVERYLQRDNRIILVTGATEQHSYLSLMTDILIPSRVALALAEREQVLCAPALNFGISDLFADFPGTISLSAATFEAVLCDIVFSLYHQGFARFFILNGHGGNRLPQRLKDLTSEGTARVVWFDWWRNPAVQAFEQEHGLKIDHANWGENFQFVRVADVPTGEKAPVNLQLLEEGHSLRGLLGDGSFGGPYQADDSLMNALFWVVVEEAARQLRQF
jgi:creatinine amidohydrolase